MPENQLPTLSLKIGLLFCFVSIIALSFVKLQPQNFECHKLVPIAWFCSMDIYMLLVVHVQSNVIWSKTIGKIREGL